MTEIPGSVYLLIGATVSIISAYLDFSKLIFFFSIGIIFILVGVAKIVITFLKKETRPKSVKSNIKICPYCSSQIYPSYNYCPYCGVRVR